MKHANMHLVLRRGATRLGLAVGTCSLGVLLGSVGCAVEAKVAPAPRYPSIAVAKAAQGPLRLVAAEGALPVTLPCASEESSEPNGIDDDCNGSIDRDDSAHVFSVAISHDPRQDLYIEVQKTDGSALTPSTHEDLGACDTTRSFAIHTISFESFEPGSYKVVITRGSRCTSADVKFSHVDFGIPGQPPTRFGRALDESAPTEVATLTIP